MSGGRINQRRDVRTAHTEWTLPGWEIRWDSRIIPADWATWSLGTSSVLLPKSVRPQEISMRDQARGRDQAQNMGSQPLGMGSSQASAAQGNVPCRNFSSVPNSIR